MKFFGKESSTAENICAIFAIFAVLGIIAGIVTGIFGVWGFSHDKGRESRDGDVKHCELRIQDHEQAIKKGNCEETEAFERVRAVKKTTIRIKHHLAALERKRPTEAGLSTWRDRHTVDESDYLSAIGDLWLDDEKLERLLLDVEEAKILLNKETDYFGTNFNGWEVMQSDIKHLNFAIDDYQNALRAYREYLVNNYGSL